MTKPAKPTKVTKTAKKIDVSVVTDVVKKIPAFLKRLKTELEKLLTLIDKAETALAAFSGLQLLTKEQKAEKRLLEKQIKAMKAYRDVLQTRIANGEAAL